MHSTTALLASILAPLALTTPSHVQERQNTLPIPLALIAAHSTSPIHLQPIAASNQAFYIGKKTTSYCPQEEVGACPAGNVTSVVVNGEGEASMNVEVPGGQVVYVLPNGALAFTPAHAEGEAGVNNGTTYGFSYIEGARGSPGQFHFQGWSWFACPVAGATNGTGPWQVYADVPGTDVGACIGFDALGETYTEGVAAWQYE